MIIDKTLNFATREELEEADELKTRYEKLIDELLQWTDEADREQDELAAKGYSKEEIKQIQTTSKQREAWATEWTEKLTETQDRTNTLSNMWIVRYIDSFNGNLEAILADAREVSDAITEQDYLTDHKQQEQTRRRKLERLSPDSSEAKDLQDLSNIGFSSCYRFLLDVLINQINAIIRYSNEHDRMQNLDLIAEIAANRALELYPPADKPAGRIEYRAMPIEDEPAEPAKAPTKQEPRKRVKELRAMPIEVIDNHEAELLAEKAAFKDLLRVPISPATDLLARALSWGRDVESSEIERMRKKVTHKPGTLKIEDLNGRRRYITETDTEKVELRINDVNTLLKSKTAKKWLVLFLNKIAEQALNKDGTLRNDHIYIEPREVVNDFNMYKTERAAVKAFLDVEPIFTGCTVKGYLKKGKNTIEQAESAVLFPFMRYKRREGFTVDINQRVNWSMVCSFFTLIHKAYFSLPNRAAELLLYIFSRARECAKETGKSGSFNISMRAVQERLGLPSEKDNREPQKTIKEPIEAAVTAIEDAIRDADFTITPFYDMSAPITSFLEKGYLHITFKGRYLEYFAKLSKEASKKITTATNRSENAKERALEKYYLNKLEESAADHSGEQPKKRRGRPPKNQ